ncbi:MAG: MurR/RpiR family transcriptional regulator [Proteobacteria bacterium]|nr:MurR/RpiR family transcriptional regulator [Pseudomonadota bacterium]
MTATEPTLEARIRDRYGELPRSERKIGDLIMDFPGQIASYSATELAELADASKAAVTRFSHRLGYGGFDAMRRAARDAQSAGSPLFLLSRDDQPRDFADQVARHLRQDADLLAQSLNGLDPTTYEASVTAISQARRLLIVGWRNSHYLAGYLRWQLIQARANVELMPAAGETLAEGFADLGAADVLVVLGYRRRVVAVSKVIDLAVAQGARVLYFTDAGAQATTAADWTVTCTIRGHDALDRYAGAMSLMHFYAMGVMRKMGAKGRGRLASIERAHEALHEFG